jgi:hypothetical protein
LDQARSKPNPNLAKSSQIGPSLRQRRSKKTAWFSLDLLVRIEPFQGLARTPWPEIIFGSPFLVQKH